jgi:hypothetical protein
MGSLVHQYRRARASEQIERVSMPAGLVPAVLARAREAEAACGGHLKLLQGHV